MSLLTFFVGMLSSCVLLVAAALIDTHLVGGPAERERDRSICEMRFRGDYTVNDTVATLDAYRECRAVLFTRPKKNGA